MEDVKLQEKIREFLAVDNGSGYGYGLVELNGQKIYRIDDTPTIITSIHGNVAKGFIMQSDLTLTPCYVVKGNNQFAHGVTLREAMTALTDKLFEDMPEQERIAEFIKAHPDKDKAYPNKDLFDWHHRLTGSCMAGRNAFVKDLGLTLDGETTVTEFIRLTENAYNGSVIKNLAKAYKEGLYGYLGKRHDLRREPQCRDQGSGTQATGNFRPAQEKKVSRPGAGTSGSGKAKYDGAIVTH